MDDAALAGFHFDSESEDEDEDKNAKERRERLLKKSKATKSSAGGSASGKRRGAAAAGRKRARAAADSEDEYSGGDGEEEESDDDDEYAAHVAPSDEDEDASGEDEDDEDEEEEEEAVAAPPRKRAKIATSSVSACRTPPSRPRGGASSGSAVLAASARKASGFGDREYAADPEDAEAGATGWQKRSSSASSGRGWGVLHGASSSIGAATGGVSSAGGTSGGWATPKAVPDTIPARPVPSGLTKQELDKTVLGYGQHEHARWSFLWMPHRRDADLRTPSDPEYDPQTLYVPPDFARDQTPAMRQWWKVKCRNMDTVLCFKVGKFYECFYTDADVLVRECDCIYMKGPKAHAGFPEIAYGPMSEALVARGYRVARVEQTETPAQLAERKKTIPKGQKKPQVVRRELCGLKSRGTRVVGPMDIVEESGSGGSSGSPGAMGALKRAREATGGALPSDAAMLLCLHETPLQQAESGSGSGSGSGSSKRNRGPNDPDVRVGMCMVDAAAGHIWLGEFLDNAQRTRLRTLAARAQVVELLTCEGNLSEPSARFLKFDCATAVRTELKAGVQFWTPSKGIEELKSAPYFDAEEGKGKGKSKGAAAVGSDLAQKWPEALRDMVRRAEAVGGVPSAAAIEGNGQEQGGGCTDVPPAAGACAAFAGALAYLRRCMIDHSVMSMGRVSSYAHDSESKLVPGANAVGSAAGS